MNGPMSKNDRALLMNQAIQESREQFTLKMELFDVIAREEKAKFDAYVAAGFSAEQALRLCMAEKHRA